MEVRGYILEEENAAKQNGAEIVMNYCNLSMFPNTLLQNEYYQNNLKKLYLKRNCIKAINSSSLLCLKSLTTLHLEANGLTELPDGLSLLTSLSHLNISGNSITAITPSLGHMKNLKNLNVSCNLLTTLPKQLWEAPSLQRLNIAVNYISALPPEIVLCQSLTNLTCDSNRLSKIPVHLFMLQNLHQASFCGNRLTSLPDLVTSPPSSLKKLYIDGNPKLRHIPISLLFVSELGVFDCGEIERAKEELINEASAMYSSEFQVPPLMELAARSLHNCFEGDLGSSGCLVRWLPEQLSSLLHLPLSLSEWLIPSGLCCRRQCRQPFFKQFYSKRVALGFCRDHLDLCDSLVEKGDKSDSLSVSISVCSLQCMQNLM